MMPRQHWRVAEFDSPQRFSRAVAELSERGVRIHETCSPYEVPGIARRLTRPPRRIPRFAFIGGLTGAVTGYGIQWYVNAWDYPLNVGGRPAHAVPSFIFVTFETLVLFASLSVFFGLLFTLGMPRYYHPLWTISGFERVSVDRFWVVVEAGPAEDPFAGLEPLRVVDLEVAA